MINIFMQIDNLVLNLCCLEGYKNASSEARPTHKLSTSSDNIFKGMSSTIVSARSFI